MMTPLRLAVIGTDTGVGKTRVAAALVGGLRGQGRRVWIHKPVACGGWDGVSADDGRVLAGLCGDGQDPATVCPRQFPEPAAPHLAAAAAGADLALADLVAACRALFGPADLVVETAGGLLSPLSSRRETNADLLRGLGLPALLVTRPDLGTINHTALTVRQARAEGITLLGLVLNHVRAPAGGLAERTAADELVAATGCPILAVIGHQGAGPAAKVAGESLAVALLPVHHR